MEGKCPLRNQPQPFSGEIWNPTGDHPPILVEQIDSDHFLYSLMEDKRLFRRLEHFKTLLTINRHIHSTLTMDEILSTILLGIIADTGFKFSRAFIFLPDDTETTLKGYLALGPEDKTEINKIWKEIISMESSPEEVLAGNRQTLKENDLKNWIQTVQFPLQEGENSLVDTYIRPTNLRKISEPDPLLSMLNVPTCVLVPFKAHGISFGVLLVDNLYTQKTFSEDTLEFLEILGSEAASAISNSILYKRLEETIDALTSSQQKLVSAERLSALGEITAQVAHEIRNPIVTLGLILSHHRKKCQLEDKDDLQAMSATLIRLEQLLVDYLSFSGKPELKRKALDLTTFLNSIIHLFRIECMEKNIIVSLYPPLEPVTVYWDPIQMQEVFVNLFHNAMGAMPDGGTISIAVHSVEGDRVHVNFSDTGAGIPPHLQSRVFEPYFTTKTTGSGIGLTLVSRIIHDHGGHIWLESTPFRGTAFIFELPAGEIST